MKYAAALKLFAGLLIASLGSFASAATPSKARSSFAVGQNTGGVYRLYNLYHENITVYSFVDGVVTILSHFKPSRTLLPYGLTVDRQGRLYTTLSAMEPPSAAISDRKAVDRRRAYPARVSDSCAVACVEIFTPKGKLVGQIAAPILPGARHAPSLTNASVDRYGNVYFSDIGQEAVYFFTPVGNTWVGPQIVVQHAAFTSALAAPYGNSVFLSGQCGFRTAVEYRRTRSGFSPGMCLVIGTTGLTGAGADDRGAVLTPVDNAGNDVMVTSTGGDKFFQVPDQYGEVASISLGLGGAYAYVASSNNLYVFARPVNGWPSAIPRLVATYKGLRGLSFIAVDP